MVGPEDGAASFPPGLRSRFAPARVVGRGGFATVFEAREQATGRRVAVKLLEPGLGEDPTLRERFALEASLAGRCLHPGLVAIVDAGEADGRLWLAMEFVEGDTLRSVLARRSALPWPEAGDLAARLAACLGALHAAGLAHRDVKPENVMLEPGGAVRLLDLGIARALDDERRLTRTGVILGTAAYLSPEGCRGERVGPPADVYALGLVLLEALGEAGHLRVWTEAPLRLLGARAAGTWRPPLPAGLPAPAREVLARLLAAAPGSRPADGAAAAAALSAALTRGGCPSEATRPVAALPPPPRRGPLERPAASGRRALLVALWTAAALGLGAGLLALRRGPAAPPNAPPGAAQDAPNLERSRAVFAALLEDLAGKGCTPARLGRLLPLPEPLGLAEATASLTAPLAASCAATELATDEAGLVAGANRFEALSAAALALSLATGPVDEALLRARLASAEAQMEFLHRFQDLPEPLATVAGYAVPRPHEPRPRYLKLVTRLEERWAAAPQPLCPILELVRAYAGASLASAESAQAMAEAARERLAPSAPDEALAAARVIRGWCLVRRRDVEGLERQWRDLLPWLRRWRLGPGAFTVTLAVELGVSVVDGLVQLGSDEAARRGLRWARALAYDFPVPGATGQVLERLREAGERLMARDSLTPRRSVVALELVRTALGAQSLLPGRTTPDPASRAQHAFEALVVDLDEPGRRERAASRLLGPRAPGLARPWCLAQLARGVTRAQGRLVAFDATREDLTAVGEVFLDLAAAAGGLVPAVGAPADEGAAEWLEFLDQALLFLDEFPHADDATRGDEYFERRRALEGGLPPSDAVRRLGEARRDDREATRAFRDALLARMAAAAAVRPAHPAMEALRAAVCVAQTRSQEGASLAAAALEHVDALAFPPGSPLDDVAAACLVGLAQAAEDGPIDAFEAAVARADERLARRPAGAPFRYSHLRFLACHLRLVGRLLEDAPVRDRARAARLAAAAVSRWRGRGLEAFLAAPLATFPWEPAERRALVLAGGGSSLPHEELAALAGALREGSSDLPASLTRCTSLVAAVALDRRDDAAALVRVRRSLLSLGGAALLVAEGRRLRAALLAASLLEPPAALPWPAALRADLRDAVEALVGSGLLPTELRERLLAAAGLEGSAAPVGPAADAERARGLTEAAGRDDEALDGLERRLGSATGDLVVAFERRVERDRGAASVALLRSEFIGASRRRYWRARVAVLLEQPCDEACAHLTSACADLLEARHVNQDLAAFCRAASWGPGLGDEELQASFAEGWLALAHLAASSGGQAGSRFLRESEFSRLGEHLHRLPPDWRGPWAADWRSLVRPRLPRDERAVAFLAVDAWLALADGRGAEASRGFAEVNARIVRALGAAAARGGPPIWSAVRRLTHRPWEALVLAGRAADVVAASAPLLEALEQRRPEAGPERAAAEAFESGALLQRAAALRALGPAGAR